MKSAEEIMEILDEALFENTPDLSTVVGMSFDADPAERAGDRSVVTHGATPLLSVRRGSEAVAFYEAAFGAEEYRSHTNAAGDIVALMSVGGTSFVVADEAPTYEQFSPEALGGTTVRIQLGVPDPDRVFRQAVEAGARLVFPVEDQSWGVRQGRLVDPYGHHWLVTKTA